MSGRPLFTRPAHRPTRQHTTTSQSQVNYQNLRAQCYYTLADYTAKHEIAVATEDTDVRQYLSEELEQIKGKDIEKDGKLKIVSKDEIKEHLGRSPDFSDALMMRMWFEVQRIAEPNVRLL